MFYGNHPVSLGPCEPNKQERLDKVTEAVNVLRRLKAELLNCGNLTEGVFMPYELAAQFVGHVELNLMHLDRERKQLIDQLDKESNK